MFPTTLLAFVLAALTSVQAIQVTSPSTSTVQSAGSALSLTWESVSTDATSFAVVLVNQNAAFLANSPVTLVTNQSTSAGSTSLSYPGGSWPAGTGFQVNLVKSTNEINSILAQSGMFNITSSGTSSSSSSAASSSSASASSSSSSASSSGTTSAATIVQSGASAVYSGNAQTTAAIPSAQTSAPASGALALGVNGALLVGALALGIAL